MGIDRCRRLMPISYPTIVPTRLRYKDISKIKSNTRNDSWRAASPMKTGSVLSRTVFGRYVILASMVSLVGCASPRAHMVSHDLDFFQIDCSRKREQIEFLQSLRNDNNERFNARVENMLTPWRAITDPDRYRENQSVGMGRHNWLITQNLISIQQQCP